MRYVQALDLQFEDRFFAIDFCQLKCSETDRKGRPTHPEGFICHIFQAVGSVAVRFYIGSKSLKMTILRIDASTCPSDAFPPTYCQPGNSTQQDTAKEMGVNPELVFANDQRMTDRYSALQLHNPNVCSLNVCIRASTFPRKVAAATAAVAVPRHAEDSHAMSHLIARGN